MAEQNEAPDVASQARQPSTVTPRFNHRFDRQALRTMLAVAAYHARRVARIMRISDVDREDVEQEILLVLLERRGFFDPARGAWSSFADRIARQAAQGAADEIGTERRVRSRSLDHSAGTGSITLGERIEIDLVPACDSEQDWQVPLALADFVATLPD